MIGYEPKLVVFDEATEITEKMWRNLMTSVSCKRVQNQMQRGAWPPDLVRYVVALTAPQARRLALHDWRAGFTLLTYGRRREVATYSHFGLARERLLWVWEALRGRPVYRPRPHLFKVYLGTFRGQRFAVSELVE